MAKNTVLYCNKVVTEAALAAVVVVAAEPITLTLITTMSSSSGNAIACHKEARNGSNSEWVEINLTPGFHLASLSHLPNSAKQRKRPGGSGDLEMGGGQVKMLHLKCLRSGNEAAAGQATKKPEKGKVD